MRKLICCSVSVMVVVILFAFPIGTAQAGKCELQAFDKDNFNVQEDNDYFPKSIGETYVYEAETEDGLDRDYIYFSPVTIDILGVACTVVHDVEWLWVEDLNAWVKLEETEDYHAWDYLGNFWYFGEATKAYNYDDDWNLEDPPYSEEGSWMADEGDNQPGIILLAEPHPGECVQQESAPDVAEDMGKVLRLNAKVSVTYGDYDNCEMTKEWSPLERGDIEHKYYAPGVGLVYIKELKEKTVTYELVDINNSTEGIFSEPAEPPL